MTRRVLVLVLAAFLGACTTTEFSRNRSAEKRPPFEGRVVVLERLPSSGYEVIGTLIITGRAYATKQNMLELLVEEAADHGANGVVLQGEPIKVQSTYGEQTKFAGTLLWLEEE